MSDINQNRKLSFRERLANLFSGQAIVRRTKDNMLKVVDPSMFQSLGDPIQPPYHQGYYSGLHTYKPTGYYTPSTAFNFNTARIELYRDYEAMDEDPILASALDIYADECTIRDPEGWLLSIKTSNEEVKQILYNLFYDILNIEFNLWPWVRNTCKYGDFYLKLELQDEIGVVNVNPMSPYDVTRSEGLDDRNMQKVKFFYNNSNSEITSTERGELDYFEVAHFRLLSDTNFLPYGRSMLEGARKEFKRLSLMEDAMMIHRIMRAPQRRVYKVNVGNLNPNEIDSYMRNIMDKNKKIPYIDEDTGQYNLKFNLLNMIEDIYIPVRGGDSQTEIDTLDGLGNEGMIEDVEYIRNKMMAALKIPKAFLGYDENLEGKAVLAAEDVRFARTIERIQKIIESELNKVAVIHLYLQGFTDHELIDFELSLNNPSIVYERQKMEIMAEKMNLINSMKDTKLFSRKYVYENILGLSSDEWIKEEDLLINDQIKEWGIAEAGNSGKDPFAIFPEEEPGMEGMESGGGDMFGEPEDTSLPDFPMERGTPFEPPREEGGEEGGGEEAPEAEGEAPEEEPIKEEGVERKRMTKSKLALQRGAESAYGRDPFKTKSDDTGFDSNFKYETKTGTSKILSALSSKYGKNKRQTLTELLNPDID